MFTFQSGRQDEYCDGVSRRNFLQLGAMGLGGLTLPGLLRAEAVAGVGSSHKAVINIHLGGGPPHQDMFDLKPEAPVEFRGEFNPINTNVSGIQICELMPQLAKMADKFAIVRSLVGSAGQHSNYQTHSGFGSREAQNVGGRPALGSFVAKLQGATPGGAPPFVSYNGGSPGFLGPVYKPYRPSGNNLRLSGSMTAERLETRTNLLSSLDRMRRDMDARGDMEAMDSFTRQAVGVVTSGKVADAVDIKKEDPAIVERYGSKGRDFLLARRLVEAGVRIVNFNWGSWDTHGQNFIKLRTQLPQLDTAMSALIDDIHKRGMADDVSIVMWGEFGRTPRVNNNAGRDHWNRLSMCFLAGGGMKTGQVVGSSTRYAEDAKDRPVQFQQVHATLYRNLGIDPVSTTVIDPSGRPQYLLLDREPIKELI